MQGGTGTVRRLSAYEGMNKFRDLDRRCLLTAPERWKVPIPGKLSESSFSSDTVLTYAFPATPFPHCDTFSDRRNVPRAGRAPYRLLGPWPHEAQL